MTRGGTPQPCARDLSGTGRIHSPPGHLHADAELQGNRLVGRPPSSEQPGRFERDKQFACQFGGFALLDLIGQTTTPLVDKAGAEMVLPDDVREFMAHSGPSPDLGMRIVLDDHGTVADWDECA